ncbi:restriction endonuclease subunit S [Enterobacter cloacae]|uniref:restriction endonuclease subunit S n=1 Tax=Enterobacteriaceae TaxID=543 RepID=UPI000B3D7EA4|nr:restriction endonuclease subunit S [Cronobacter sakazakii]PUW87442.1 restriction endonuclease subunit S [Cronobacter sakazakii]
MNAGNIVDAFVSDSKWNSVPAKRLFTSSKEINQGMKESNRLALTMKGVINRSLDDLQGLQSSDYSVYQIFEKDDLVFKLIDLENIKTSRVGIVHERGIMSPAYIRVSASSNSIYPRFYYWYFFALYLTNIYNKLGGGVRQNLTAGDLLEIPVPLIDISLQKQVSTFLDRETQRIDSLIEEKQTFIKLLKEKRQALISHVVTKGLNPNVEMQDSGIEWIGQVPKHWEVKKIKHICSNFMYGTSQDCNQSDVGYPVLRIPNIKSTNVDFEDLKYANISDVDALTYLLSRGDILVIRTNGNPNLVGQSALFDSNGQYLFASYLIKLTPKRGVDTSFLVEAMNSLSVRQALTFQSRTSVGNYNLSIPSLANTSIAIPPIDEQKTITNYLSAATINIDLLIQETDKSIDLLKEHRTSLINAAVTGKIDVREVV